MICNHLILIVITARIPNTEERMERTYGVSKRRFPCLSRGLTTKLLCSTTIIVACAVLHNMALPFNDVLLEDDEFPKEEEDELPAVPPQWPPLEGFATREALIARMFNE